MNRFVLKFKSGRFIWTILTTGYFLVFFTNLLRDAIPEQMTLPLIFAYIFILWLGLEYYFGSPFFQSGVVEPNPLWRAIFAFFFYPYLGYLGGDYIWWRWTQIPISAFITGIAGLLIFGLGVYLRLATLFALLGIVQIKPGIGVTVPVKGFLGLRWQRLCRHPRYFAVLMIILGSALVFNSYGGLILALVLGLPLIYLQVRYEERLLKETMKPDYERYAETVPILIPIPSRRFRK